jgi:hypothetical protein
MCFPWALARLLPSAVRVRIRSRSTSVSPPTSKLGVDWTNCLVIAVQSPVQLSYLVAVGENLSFTHCPADSLEGVLLSHVPQVLSERRCLLIEGRARLREIGILYRSALYPLSDDGIAIDHLLGAANYRPLHENEHLRTPLVRTKWL